MWAMGGGGEEGGGFIPRSTRLVCLCKRHSTGSGLLGCGWHEPHETLHPLNIPSAAARRHLPPFLLANPPAHAQPTSNPFSEAGVIQV